MGDGTSGSPRPTADWAHGGQLERRAAGNRPLSQHSFGVVCQSSPSEQSVGVVCWGTGSEQCVGAISWRDDRRHLTRWPTLAVMRPHTTANASYTPFHWPSVNPTPPPPQPEGRGFALTHRTCACPSPRALQMGTQSCQRSAARQTAARCNSDTLRSHRCAPPFTRRCEELHDSPSSPCRTHLRRDGDHVHRGVCVLAEAELLFAVRRVVAPDGVPDMRRSLHWCDSVPQRAP